MSLPQSSQNLTRYNNMPIVSYEPAELKEWETGWQIEFKVFNPATLKMEKQRQRFDKIKKKFGEVGARKQARMYRA